MKKIVVAVDCNNDGVIYVDGELLEPTYGGSIGFDYLAHTAKDEPFVFKFVEVDDEVGTWPATLAEVEAMVAKGGEE